MLTYVSKYLILTLDHSVLVGQSGCSMNHNNYCQLLDQQITLLWCIFKISIHNIEQITSCVVVLQYTIVLL